MKEPPDQEPFSRLRRAIQTKDRLELSAVFHEIQTILVREIIPGATSYSSGIIEEAAAETASKIFALAKDLSFEYQDRGKWKQFISGIFWNYLRNQNTKQTRYSKWLRIIRSTPPNEIDDAYIYPKSTEELFARFPDQDSFRIKRWYSNLSTRDQKVLRLYLIDCFSRKEIGEQLGISPRAASNIIKRKLDDLGKFFQA